MGCMSGPKYRALISPSDHVESPQATKTRWWHIALVQAAAGLPTKVKDSLTRAHNEWKHELTYLKLLGTLHFKDAAFYLANAKSLDALASTSDFDKPLRSLVKSELEAVSQLIQGGRQFIEVKDTMSLGSVVVSTLFLSAYLVYFFHQGAAIHLVNSKVHDALAIVLPMLLTEELAVTMSQVVLWCQGMTFKSPTSNARTSPSKPSTLRSKHRPSIAKDQLQRQKTVFDRLANRQCSSVGVGAIDMTGLSALIASLWTFLFLVQGYVVEVLRYTPSSSDTPLMVDTYWCIVYCSCVLVGVCYVPFFCSSSKAQKDEFDSVAASCESFLLVQRMTQLQDRVVRAIGAPTRVDAAADAIAAVRHLRKQVVYQMDTDRIVSYALYVLALSTYDFFTGQVEGIPLGELQNYSPLDEVPLEPINQASSWYWSVSLDDAVAGGRVDDAFPAFLLRVPELSAGSPPDLVDDSSKDMTLFSVPVMGILTLEDVLTQRNVTDMHAVYENPLVQAKRVYLPEDESHDLVCIGLEVKLMEHYTTCIYVVADAAATFGRGRVYVTAARPLQTVVRVKVDSDETMTFVEVAEEDQLRAFAMCCLDVDPKIVRRNFKRKQGRPQ